jgi:hypothetical protein
LFSCGTAYGLLSDKEKRHPRKRRRSPEYFGDSGALIREDQLWVSVKSAPEAV